MTPSKILFIIFFSLILISIVFFSVLGLIGFILVAINKRAVMYSLVNPLYCGTNVCKAIINDSLSLDDSFVIEPSKYQKQIAVICLDLLSRVAFYKDTQLALQGIGEPKLKIFNKLDTKNQFGQIWLNDKYCWIALRGTELSFGEWIADFSIEQVSETHNKDKINIPLFLKQNPDILIHRGFCEILGQISDNVINFVQENSKGKKIIICGHSLGGAIGTLLALELKLLGFDVLLYITASPRVGNNDFVEYVKSTKLNVYSQINTEDIIPNTPLSVAVNTQNPEKPYFYSATTNAMTFTSNWYSISNNHTIANYQQHVLP